MSIDAPVRADVQAILDSFERLAEQERRDVLARLLVRVRDLDWPPIEEDALDQIAAESFAMYDREEEEKEAADGRED
jgi:hypothetical protein